MKLFSLYESRHKLDRISNKQKKIEIWDEKEIELVARQ